jgi:hypothetical protein
MFTTNLCSDVGCTRCLYACMIIDGTRIAAAVACGAHISCVAGQDGARGGIRLANMRVLNLLQKQQQSQVCEACCLYTCFVCSQCRSKPCQRCSTSVIH